MEDADKTGKGAVVSPLHLRREDACGELVILQMVGDTIAALSLT